MSVAASLSFKKSETVVIHAPDDGPAVDNSLASRGFKYCPRSGHADIWISKPKALGGYKTRSCPECDKERMQSLTISRPVELAPLKAGRTDLTHPLYKVVFLGSSMSGKTCIYTRLVENQFPVPSPVTMGLVDSFIKIPYGLTGFQEATFNLCDTGGVERFQPILPLFLRNAHAAVFCFDVTRREPFRELQKFVDIVNNTCGEGKVVMTFLGNKIDLPSQRHVSRESGEALAAKYGGKYFECSAKTGDGVHTAFQHVADEVVYGDKVHILDCVVEGVRLSGSPLSFDVNGSAAQVLQALQQPQLSATLYFQEIAVEGIHMGAGASPAP